MVRVVKVYADWLTHRLLICRGAEQQIFAEAGTKEPLSIG